MSEEEHWTEERHRLVAYLGKALSPGGFEVVMRWLGQNEVGKLRVDATANETIVWAQIYREQYPLLTGVELSGEGEQMNVKSLVRELGPSEYPRFNQAPPKPKPDPELVVCIKQGRR